MNINRNVLIAYMPSRKDLRIAQDKHWYRIPFLSQNVPNIVKNNSIELIAFYFPKIFGEDAHLIRYYGIVKSITLSKRKSLFRNEPLNPNSEKLYYKICFDKLLRLPKTIVSLRKRRILFITTSIEKFQTAEEINDLY